MVTISHTASGNVQQDSIWTKSKGSNLESEDLEVTLEFDSLQRGNEICDHDSANRSEMQQKDGDFKHQDSSGSNSVTTAELMTPPSTKKVPAAHAIVRRHQKHGPDAIIVLKEERVRSLIFP